MWKVHQTDLPICLWISEVRRFRSAYGSLFSTSRQARLVRTLKSLKKSAHPKQFVQLETRAPQTISPSRFPAIGCCIKMARFPVDITGAMIFNERLSNAKPAGIVQKSHNRQDVC